MPRRLRSLLILLLLAASVAPAFAAPARPPKLVVVLVVDQMRADYIDRYSGQWTAGLRRLLTEGAWFRRANYPYASTVTCVGHATVSTGAFPWTHGIVGNSWYDREAGRTVRCTDDPSVKTVSYAGPVSLGNSAQRLLATTLSDELRSQLPGPTRVVSFSMKERTAIMLGGHRPDAATWFNPGAGGFITSSAFTAEPVPWVAAALKARPVAQDFGRVWTRMLPADRYQFEDKGIGEKPEFGWGVEFPHDPKGASTQPDTAFYTAWESTPFSDAYLGYLAGAAVDALKLGQGRGTDFLGVSFSALDLVGHDYGFKSHEAQDILIQLDQTIGRLLAHLDRAVGAGRYVVALTADHGSAPIPEQVSAAGLPAGRLDTKSVTQAAQKGLEAAFGPGSYAVRLSNSDLYLDATTVDRLRRDPLARETVVRAIRAVPGVGDAYMSDALDSHAAAGDRIAKAALVNYFPGRSGDIVVVPKPYWFYVTADGTAQPGDATSHGTPYAYDQHVPILLFGSGIARGEYLRAVTPSDIAPTLALLAGVTLPHPDGTPLVEAIAPAPATPPTPAAASTPPRQPGR